VDRTTAVHQSSKARCLNNTMLTKFDELLSTSQAHIMKAATRVQDHELGLLIRMSLYDSIESLSNASSTEACSAIGCSAGMS